MLSAIASPLPALELRRGKLGMEARAGRTVDLCGVKQVPVSRDRHFLAPSSLTF